MLGPSAILVEVWRKPMEGSKSADDFVLLHTDFEMDPPTPMRTDEDMIALVEVSEQRLQCWTEEEREIRKGDKLIWTVADDDVREYLLKDITDTFDIPIGRTSKRLTLARLKK